MVAKKGIGITARGPILVSPERYSPVRIAEFLLCNAICAADCQAARKEVRKLGLDPDSIRHWQP